jgi:hypothetical protein
MKPRAVCTAGRANAAESTWMPLVVPCGHLDAPCPAHYHDADVRTNTARVPFTRPSFAAAPLRRTSTLTLPPSRHLLSSLMVQPTLLLLNVWR